MKPKLLLIFISVISLLTACKKDADAPPQPDPPVTEPLTVAAVKPGDTLFIKGENFSDVIANNTVKVNGVAATVVVASATELKVIIPANATSGTVTVTVNGKTTEVGSIIIAPFTLYAYKRNYDDPDNTIAQVVSIDPATGSETLVVNLNNYEMGDMVYLPSTHELVGINFDTALTKINLTTKQITTVVLGPQQNIDFQELVVDKYNNLYAVKRDWSDEEHYKHSLVKIDPATGTYTSVKTFEYNPYWERLVYLPATHEVVGLANTSRGIFRLNLDTKDTSTVELTGVMSIEYRELAVDNQSNLYSYKGNYADPDNYIGVIVKLNLANGQETTYATITDYGKFHDNFIFIPHRNELVSIWDQTGLYRLNIGTKEDNIIPVTTAPNTTYNEITSN